MTPALFKSFPRIFCNKLALWLLKQMVLLWKLKLSLWTRGLEDMALMKGKNSIVFIIALVKGASGHCVFIEVIHFMVCVLMCVDTDPQLRRGGQRKTCRGQFCLLPSRSCDWNSGHQAWQKMTIHRFIFQAMFYILKAIQGQYKNQVRGHLVFCVEQNLYWVGLQFLQIFVQLTWPTH